MEIKYLERFAFLPAVIDNTLKSKKIDEGHRITGDNLKHTIWHNKQLRQDIKARIYILVMRFLLILRRNKDWDN